MKTNSTQMKLVWRGFAAASCATAMIGGLLPLQSYAAGPVGVPLSNMYSNTVSAQSAMNGRTRGAQQSAASSASAAGASSPVQSASQKMFIWKDNEGVTHIDSKAPEGMQVKGKIKMANVSTTPDKPVQVDFPAGPAIGDAAQAKESTAKKSTNPDEMGLEEYLQREKELRNALAKARNQNNDTQETRIRRSLNELKATGEQILSGGAAAATTAK